MDIREYERAHLIITEFSDDDIITTSGEVMIPLDEYEGRQIVEE